MIRTVRGHVDQQPVEARRQADIRFCRYRLEVLLTRREQDKAVIAAVEQRLRELQS
jgi:hypothetical protein